MNKVKIDVKGDVEGANNYLKSLGYRGLLCTFDNVFFLYGNENGSVSWSGKDRAYFDAQSNQEIFCKVPSTSTKWTFNVNAEYQIDFDSIANDLTKERQITIVTTSKGETTVMLVNG